MIVNRQKGPHIRSSGLALIFGGARSGKSRLAERLALTWAERALYLATAQAFDDEMETRIEQHRARRGTDWETLEVPLELAPAIASESRPDRAILVDCLSLWLSNLLHAERDVAREQEKLVEALIKASGPVVLVSNEVGMGIVPMNALARRFRDLQGQLNQRLAQEVELAIFCAAGLPLVLKGSLPPLHAENFG